MRQTNPYYIDESDASVGFVDDWRAGEASLIPKKAQYSSIFLEDKRKEKKRNGTNKQKQHIKANKNNTLNRWIFLNERFYI